MTRAVPAGVASGFALALHPMSDAPPPAGCPNCFEPLGEPRPRFCPHCGQETHVRPPTLGEFVQQFGGAFFSTEGALWRTLVLLLTRPGELTRQYLAGRRRHYVLPLRLYLTISLFVLFGLRVAASLGVDEGAVQVEVGSSGVAVELGVGRAGMKDGAFFCENLPAWLCRRLQRRIDIEPRALARETAELPGRLTANLGGAMFVLLPAFALYLKLAYWNRRLRYTEHLVFALHLHAFWFVALAVLLTGVPWLSAIALVAMPVYAMLALRRVYGGRLGPRLVRAALVGVLYLLTLLLALAGVAVWALLF
jgi:hypothetical protein